MCENIHAPRLRIWRKNTHRHENSSGAERPATREAAFSFPSYGPLVSKGDESVAYLRSQIVSFTHDTVPPGWVVNLFGIVVLPCPITRWSATKMVRMEFPVRVQLFNPSFSGELASLSDSPALHRTESGEVFLVCPLLRTLPWSSSDLWGLWRGALLTSELTSWTPVPSS